ncbi:MAG: tRNA (adenosine(37)-N6)-threonylcarbamoyltransferase complex ATPase subunit type 1 TsaE, partial [Rhodospirillales bacterium]|nr:tRNA (adenosine(37)-N6)-threonylcarbamoyltransferase complex ATPase subunit type 1 TsaE [Rhodospirillales bacterium]
AEDEAEDVPSPTFTLVQLYETEAGIIWHFDLYRLRHPQDALELGIEEAFSEGICLVEWPDRLGIHLPRDRVDVTFQHAGGNHRRALLEGRGEWGRRIEELQTHG